MHILSASVEINFFRQAGGKPRISCPDSWCYRYNSGWLRGLHPESGRKVIAKLNYETSSIGLGVENIFDFNLDVETFIHSLSQTYQ